MGVKMFRMFPGANTGTSCLDCKERYLGCHDHCERYLKEKAERLEKNRELKKKRSLCLEYYHHKISKMQQEDKRKRY